MSITHTTSPPYYYPIVIRLLTPIYRLWVWYRSRHNDNYRQEVADRFGQRYNMPTMTSHNQPMIWCHAVSLGETNTIAPILKQLLADGCQIWLTNTTQTGFVKGEQTFAKEIKRGQVQHGYMPIDSNKVIQRFLSHVQPSVALFVETELWANTLYQLAKNNTPTILVNARLSKQSFINYHKFAKLSSSMMDNLTLILAQDEISAEHFLALGATVEKIAVVGSLKWSVELPATSKIIDKSDIKQAITNRTIWVASSTHEGEEQVVLAVQQKLMTNLQTKALNPLLIIVPRHPERFDSVAKQIKDVGLTYCRRSLNELPKVTTQVYLADSMGEMSLWYELAEVAFVGGSMVNVGGHNPIEALLKGTPVIMGKFTQSLTAVIDELQQQGVLYQLSLDYSHTKGSILEPDIQLKLVNQLYQQLSGWLLHADLRHLLGENGRVLIKKKQKVKEHQLQMIKRFIDKE